jgi:2,3-bisphosphoglycerate-dependent phosphoglycerate mutase
MTHLYIVRHGQSQAAVEGRVAGIKADTGLSELGIEQATRLRNRLQATQEIQADVLIASTIPRATQTAEIIAPALGLPIILDDEVQELRPGEADGLSGQEYRQKYAHNRDNHSAFVSAAPGGESWPEFVLRASRALERITTEHAGKTIVLVCHGGIVQSSFLYFFGASTLVRPSIVTFEMGNAAITHWERGNFYRKDPNHLQWKLICHNDDFHLRDPRFWTDFAEEYDEQHGEMESDDTQQTAIVEKE